MLSDIEIAQQATLLPVKEVAAQIGITEDELEFYGKYKAKLSDELSARVSANPDGKLILVTAINPTPAGEGKTTTTAGLGQAMAKIGKKAIIALREPENLLSVPYSASRAALQAAATLRYSRWRTSTFTLQAICTRLPLRTTFAAPCSTTICSRAMLWASTRAESFSSAVLT